MPAAEAGATYSQYKDQLMAVGRARQTGIEVPGVGIVSAGKFEELAGSKLHRPNQHTLAPSGNSLQVECLLLYTPNCMSCISHYCQNRLLHTAQLNCVIPACNGIISCSHTSYAQHDGHAGYHGRLLCRRCRQLWASSAASEARRCPCSATGG